MKAMNYFRAILCLLSSTVVLNSTVTLVAQESIHAVLPNGREIRPVGNWIPLAPYPFALAVRGDSHQIAIPSVGFPFALNIVEKPESTSPSAHRMPSGEESDPKIQVHAGLAYSPDGELLYVATGDSGKIQAYRTKDWQLASETSLDGPIPGGAQKAKPVQESFAATLTLSKDGKTLFALDQGNWRVVIIDTGTMEKIAAIPTGRYPYELTLSPDAQRLYVTNTGLFEYTLIPGVDSKDPIRTGLHFPPSGYPSARTRNGAIVNGRKIPGLGDENSTSGSSVWTYDVHEPRNPVLKARLRVGQTIGETRRDAVGGAAPTGIASSEDAVYVTLAHQDSVLKISADGSRILGEAKLSPFEGSRFLDKEGRALRGVMPTGIAVHGSRVYVAEAGINAAAILDAGSMKVLTHLPVGWDPSSIALSPDGSKLYVVNSKGKGTGPNAGAGHDPKAPSYIGSLESGSLSVISLADLPADLTKLSQEVVAGNTAAIAKESLLPHLKHCFLIIRENRTYDEVLGDVPGTNGDPSLARYGMDGWAENSKTAVHLKVTPNLHALASQFAISDNFYVDSEVSADGHRWIMGIRPTPFFQTAVTSNYGGRRHSTPEAEEPGRRAIFGGADAPMPEDEPQFGSLWEHLVNSGKRVLNYGEGLELEGNMEMPGAEPEGQRLVLNAPLPKPVYDSSDRSFPTFNLGIPDQIRATEFERDFRKRLAAGTVPELIVIRLPNDHTASPRPNDGYPYKASYVADNDLALGRIVQFLSHTPIWKDSAVFVTEDDAQDGVDHVDAHRSILLVASPWVKPGSVSHTHSDMSSISRTIDVLLGIGFMNLEDALAGEIGGIFISSPELGAYQAADADPRIFVPAKARTAKPKTKEEAAELRNMDDSEEIREHLEKSKDSLKRKRDKD